MRTRVKTDSWTNVMTTSVDTLMSAEGDVRFYTVGSGGSAPSDVYDGHKMMDGEGAVIPPAIDIYVRALDSEDATVVTTEYGN